MPYKPKRPCSYPGCPNLISPDKRYCPIHEKKIKKSIDRDRESAYKRGYGSNWRKYREWYLRRHPLCVKCGRLATVVDHIVPVSLGGDFWDENNHQALCEECHNRKTMIEMLAGVRR
ncbi:MAG: HNH endonuclease [Candidatus Hodarchaeales archaeon]